MISEESILAGPLVRRVSPKEFTLWLVSDQELALKLRLNDEEGNPLFEGRPSQRTLALGKCVVHFLTLHTDAANIAPLPEIIYYQLSLRPQNPENTESVSTPTGVSLQQILPRLSYTAREQTLGLQVPVAGALREIWHGSCRKPHYPAKDGLAAADQELARRRNKEETTPQALFMTGDQVYIDDVCGPMLIAIRQVVQHLQLPEEDLHVGTGLYDRRNYLPSILAENRWSRLFYRKTALLTSQYCDNHLMTFSEMLALYLLCWSPTLWEQIELPTAREATVRYSLNPAQSLLYATEYDALRGFIEELPQAQRLMAHLPCYMIFDDHDVTDDWNLSSAWERAVYGHPVSERIVGNALMAYWICQGWGNNPTAFEELWPDALEYARNTQHQHHFIEHLLRFRRWDYRLPTSPPVFVMDTRTRRWEAPHDPRQPSGLMDRAALQENLRGIPDHEAVILISAAPVFGLKVIETLQAVASKLGFALAVDAENWMAHSGSARTLLNFLSAGSRRITILSGDVHYSFVYDVVLRLKHGTRIWQITASGLKNAFPQKLLNRLSLSNHFLYHPLSPLNLFTKRRKLWVQPRRAKLSHSDDSFGDPQSVEALSRSGMGQVCFDEEGTPVKIAVFDKREQAVFEKSP